MHSSFKHRNCLVSGSSDRTMRKWEVQLSEFGGILKNLMFLFHQISTGRCIRVWHFTKEVKHVAWWAIMFHVLFGILTCPRQVSSTRQHYIRMRWRCRCFDWLSWWSVQDSNKKWPILHTLFLKFTYTVCRFRSVLHWSTRSANFQYGRVSVKPSRVQCDQTTSIPFCHRR